MGSAWFETVAEAQRRARKRLPAVGLRRAAGRLRDAARPWRTTSRRSPSSASRRTWPGYPPQRDLATTVLGQPVSLPVIISPTGVQAVHPDGEVAVARAAAARGTAMGLSSFASKPVEEVVAANPQTLLPALLVRQPGPDRWPGWSGPGRPAPSG